MSFRHVWADGDSSKPVVLALHGTGADENDLLPLVREVAPGFRVLSPLGHVRENGMPRWFERRADGSFVEDDVTRRVADLLAWLKVAAAERGFDWGDMVALGYSNGANMANALLLTDPTSLKGVAAVRSRLPFQPDEVDLKGKRVLVASGTHDPYFTEGQVQACEMAFVAAGADVRRTVHPGGHEIGAIDLQALRDFFAAY